MAAGLPQLQDAVEWQQSFHNYKMQQNGSRPSTTTRCSRMAAGLPQLPRCSRMAAGLPQLQDMAAGLPQLQHTAEWQQAFHNYKMQQAFHNYKIQQNGSRPSTTTRCSITEIGFPQLQDAVVEIRLPQLEDPVEWK